MQRPGPAPHFSPERAIQRQQKPQHQGLRQHTPWRANLPHSADVHRSVRCRSCLARHSPLAEAMCTGPICPETYVETEIEIGLPAPVSQAAASAAGARSPCASARLVLCDSVHQKSAPRPRLAPLPLWRENHRVIASVCERRVQSYMPAPKHEWEICRNRKRSSSRRYRSLVQRRQPLASLLRFRA